MSKAVCIVRVGTSGYKRGDTYFYGRTIRVLQSKSTYDYMADEAQAVGVEDGAALIVNIDKVPDGLYRMEMSNVGYDYESGYADDWEYTLYPYEEPK